MTTTDNFDDIRRHTDGPFGELRIQIRHAPPLPQKAVPVDEKCGEDGSRGHEEPCWQGGGVEEPDEDGLGDISIPFCQVPLGAAPVPAHQ